jgi:cysteine desulfurase / selenocysteine lyase
MTFNALEIAKDFPILGRTIRDGKKLVYLDSGATSQKPNSVIDAESNFYRQHNAAAHRGAHQLAEEATTAMENARAIVAKFIVRMSMKLSLPKALQRHLTCRICDGQRSSR